MPTDRVQWALVWAAVGMLFLCVLAVTAEVERNRQYAERRLQVLSEAAKVRPRAKG